MNVGSLFSGAGLMDWGLTRAGFEHSWFCESDAYCQSVLRKRWPGVAVYDDVRLLCSGRGVRPLPVDVLAGGFPCQDVSVAGKREGLAGERSGLWTDFARIIGDLRPGYVFVENVAALLVRGFDRVLGDLAALGYDAEWDCVPAAAVGAPHYRDRLWLLAYTDDTGRGERQRRGPVAQEQPVTERSSSDVPDTNGQGRSLVQESPARRWLSRAAERRSDAAAGDLAVPRWAAGGWWATEPDVGRVAHGVPARVDRLRALGNGALPQLAEWVGARILEREGVR